MAGIDKRGVDILRKLDRLSINRGWTKKESRLLSASSTV